jgi:hypothetical protein
MSISDFSTTNQPARASLSLLQLKRVKAQQRATSQSLIVDGAIAAQGNFRNFEHTALSGPVHWDATCESNFALPHVEDYRQDFIFRYPYFPDVWTGPHILRMIDDDSEQLERSYHPGVGVDGFELVFEDTDDMTDPSVVQNELFNNKRSFRAGKVFNMSVRFARRYPVDDVPSNVSKRSFTVSCRLEGAPLTVIILGAEEYEGRTILRPFNQLEAVTVDVQGFTDVRMTYRGFNLRSTGQTELTTAILRSLTPMPTDLIRAAEAELRLARMMNGSEPLIQQLTTLYRR